MNAHSRWFSAAIGLFIVSVLSSCQNQRNPESPGSLNYFCPFDSYTYYEITEENIAKACSPIELTLQDIESLRDILRRAPSSKAKVVLENLRLLVNSSELTLKIDASGRYLYDGSVGGILSKSGLGEIQNLLEKKARFPWSVSPSGDVH